MTKHGVISHVEWVDLRRAHLPSQEIDGRLLVQGKLISAKGMSTLTRQMRVKVGARQNVPDNPPLTDSPAEQHPTEFGLGAMEWWENEKLHSINSCARRCVICMRVRTREITGIQSQCHFLRKSH